MISEKNYERILFHLFEVERKTNFELNKAIRYKFETCDCPVANFAPNTYKGGSYQGCRIDGTIRYGDDIIIKGYSYDDSLWWKSICNYTKKRVLSRLVKDINKYGDINIPRYNTLIHNLLSLEKFVGTRLKLIDPYKDCPILACCPPEDVHGNIIKYWYNGVFVCNRMEYKVYSSESSYWWDCLSDTAKDKYMFRMKLWLKYKD